MYPIFLHFHLISGHWDMVSRETFHLTSFPKLCLVVAVMLVLLRISSDIMPKVFTFGA
jgi:hypothetical protein